MIILILAVLGTGLFVVGISFAFRGYWAYSKSDRDAVSQASLLEKNIAVLRQREGDLQSQLKTAQDELKQFHGSVDNAKKSEASLKQELESTRKNFEEIKKKNEVQLAEIFALIDNLKSENETRRKNEALLQSEAKGLQSELIEKNRALEELEKEKKLAQNRETQALGSPEEIQALKAENQSLKEKETILKGQLKHLEEEIALLKAGSVGK